ncbi:hypothetical protein QBC40DRAFT_50227 [Triangularia verruculosa]|uniref:CFEM domain-containing protein n=1 Tax=Triangularia verruculosa TaxID=2587418 RepID=A0AAN7AXP8_9PEZI|nr:hypothetical protein QBC40DRAFT_50227 [Triangularia verruculosa]
MHPPLSVRQFRWNWYLTLQIAFLLTLGIHAQNTTTSGDAETCLSLALVAIPDCAKSCFLEQAPSIGCSALDFACQCAKQAAFYSSVEACVVAACEAEEYQKVIDGVGTVCECAVDAKDHSHSSSAGSFISQTPTSAPSAPPVVIIATTTTTPDPEEQTQTSTSSTQTQTTPLPEAENGADHTSSTSRLGLMISVFGAALAFALL